MADTQANVVSIERTVQINDLAAQAAIKKAEGEAKSKTINAEADATVLKIVGAAEGEKIKAVGTAEADVITLKIRIKCPSRRHAAIEVSKNLAGVQINGCRILLQEAVQTYVILDNECSHRYDGPRQAERGSPKIRYIKSSCTAERCFAVLIYLSL